MKKILPQLSTYDIECLQAARDFIEKDPATRYTVARLAALAGMSTTKFKTSFKTHFGYNVFEYGQMLRMNLAYKLVKENYHSIKSIAYACGFLHASHFNTAFKKKFGVSARQMRLGLKR